MTLPVPSLQKQGGCFNHGVVTLVADKLDCIRQHERLLPSSSFNHNTPTTLRTSVKGVITNALQSCFALNASR